MSVVYLDFKITPPKVKPRRGMSLVLLILRPLICVLGPSIVPLIVYLVEGCTNLFFWMLGFGSLISLILLIVHLGKVKDVIQYLKTSCCEAIYRSKLFQVPSHCKNLSPLKPSSPTKNSPDPLRSHTLDGFDLPQSTTSTIVEMPISIDCPPSSASSGELHGVGVSQQPVIFTPTKRRVISASSVSLSPLRNETKASKKTLPFSKRRLGSSGSVPPRHLGLLDASNLPTILESPYADCNVDILQSRNLSCFSS
ncbi:hypothetical protein AVEN_22764-1 [Araneus ventricosus]|uniref:Uncharacterized protein n=1 Tax=Araneus ventricosus TaxID=182803 RepID=A0A4Y2S0Q1_ARAVE|nr:hypothetical protein AVEN_22764-1 [Araneus ventricosus]